MKGQALSVFPYPYLTVFGLIVFFLFFMMMVLWVFHKSQKEKMDYMSQLPLQKDKENNYENRG